MRFRTILFICISVFFSFILQTTLFKVLAFGGISPNLLLLIVALFGLMFGRKVGLMTGFFAGLFIDMFFGSSLCFYALIYMYLGYMNGFFHRLFFNDDIKLPIALIAMSDLVYCLVIYILTFLLRGRFHFGHYFLHIILPEIAYTVILSLFLCPFLIWAGNRLNQKPKGSLNID